VSLLAIQEDFRLWLTTETDDANLRLGGVSAPGLAVYLNNYRGQLMACLTASYPMLQAWLGTNAFHGAAALHVDRVAPSDWTLDAYALNFPGTLIELFPSDPEISELAMLERGLDLAFVGEDAPATDVGTLGNLDWDRARFNLVPTLSTYLFATNACAIWSAIAVGSEPPPAVLLDEPVCVALWRHGLTPMFRTLPQLEAIALEMAREGRDFGQICSSIVEIAGPSDGLQRAGEYLAGWLQSGIIQSIES